MIDLTLFFVYNETEKNFVFFHVNIIHGERVEDFIESKENCLILIKKNEDLFIALKNKLEIRSNNLFLQKFLQIFKISN